MKDEQRLNYRRFRDQKDFKKGIFSNYKPVYLNTQMRQTYLKGTH